MAQARRRVRQPRRQVSAHSSLDTLVVLARCGGCRFMLIALVAWLSALVCVLSHRSASQARGAELGVGACRVAKHDREGATGRNYRETGTHCVSLCAGVAALRLLRVRAAAARHTFLVRFCRTAAGAQSAVAVAVRRVVATRRQYMLRLLASTNENSPTTPLRCAASLNLAQEKATSSPASRRKKKGAKTEEVAQYEAIRAELTQKQAQLDNEIASLSKKVR